MSNGHRFELAEHGPGETCATCGTRRVYFDARKRWTYSTANGRASRVPPCREPKAAAPKVTLGGNVEIAAPIARPAPSMPSSIRLVHLEVEGADADVAEQLVEIFSVLRSALGSGSK